MPDNHATQRDMTDAAKGITPRLTAERIAVIEECTARNEKEQARLLAEAHEMVTPEKLELIAVKVSKEVREELGPRIDEVLARHFKEEFAKLPERLEQGRRELFKKLTEASWEELGFK